MSDFLFRGDLAELDPDVYKLTQLEAERQYRKLILIASESTAPMAVREALSSAFQNIYAEGYPDEESRWMDDEDILDYPAGTRFYIPNVRRYFIVEDTCGDGDTPQNGPCHTGYPKGTTAWVDMWIGEEQGGFIEAARRFGLI